ncbi:MAG: DUF1592 domain-containing protein [Myxococcota bacterium]
MGALIGVAPGCRDDSATPSGEGSTDDGADDVATSLDGADESTSGGEAEDETGDDVPPTVDGVGPTGMRRLTRYEFDNAVRDLVRDDTRPSQALLPEEERTPFDNEYAGQIVTQPLVESIEILSRQVAQDFVADAVRLESILPCEPTGADDEACLRSFVESFGRLALRRPIDGEEVDEFVALGSEYALQADDFNAGIEVVVRAFLQDAEFVYRIEVGTEVPDEPGLFALDAFEVASRMSFFLWGSTPNAALLDAAESGMLDDADGVRAMAATMLADVRARGHVDRFHSLWLGYSQLPHPPALTNAMRTETAALIERVVFDDATSWLDLFTASETYLDDALAEHYGLPAPPDGEGWVDYGDSGRMGLFSHGSFLSVASNVADTSPTKRGAFIRDQVMCMPVPPPPPDVMTDNPPDGEVGECKIDRYAAHRTGTCAACHEQMDYIGFGLENYDRAGVFRTTDDGLPQCEISGEGEVTGLGEFVGPAGLAELLVDNALLESCVTQQLFRYAMGREANPDDAAYLTALSQGFEAADYRFDGLMLELVGHEAFRYRRQEEE